MFYLGDPKNYSIIHGRENFQAFLRSIPVVGEFELLNDEVTIGRILITEEGIEIKINRKKILLENCVLIPAYGRKCATIAEAQRDFDSGLDFQILNGPYCSIRDFRKAGVKWATVLFDERYANGTMEVKVKNV